MAPIKLSWSEAEVSEAKLKHHLEGVVEQANARVENVGEEDGDSEADEDGPESAGADQGRDPDAEMTERFRSD